jgi:hypothetical protein
MAAPPAPLLPRRVALLGGLTCACGACGGAQPVHAQSSLYERYFAFAMAHTMATYEAAIQPVKQRLFGELLADGNVTSILEVGIGTGRARPVHRGLQGVACALRPAL